MSNLDGAAEIFEQTSARVNQRGHRGKFGWNVSPSIERASAAHEKKKAPKPIAAKQPPVESVVNPPTVTCLAFGDRSIGRFAQRLQRQAFRERGRRAETEAHVARFPRGNFGNVGLADHHH